MLVKRKILCWNFVFSTAKCPNNRQRLTIQTQTRKLTPAFKKFHRKEHVFLVIKDLFSGLDKTFVVKFSNCVDWHFKLACHFLKLIYKCIVVF